MLDNPWFWVSIALLVLGGMSLSASQKTWGWVTLAIIPLWPFVAIFAIIAGVITGLTRND